MPDLQGCGCAGIAGPVINLVKVNVGAGILSMPLCFLLVGHRAGLGLLLLFGVVGSVTVGMLATVAERTGGRSLEEVTERLLGPAAARVLQLTSACSAFRAACAALSAALSAGSSAGYLTSTLPLAGRDIALHLTASRAAAPHSLLPFVCRLFALHQ